MAYKYDSHSLNLPRGMKRCAFCAEEIWQEAVKCRFCGEMLKRGETLQEVIVLDCKPALRCYAGRMVIGTLLLPLFGLGLIVFLLVALDRAGKRFKVTTRRVVVQRGLISKNIDEINIKDIRNINTRQKPFQRLFGYGDVLIGTAATAGNEIIVSGIARPVRFKEAVMQQKV